jgi:hypothetical protein
VSGLAFKPCGHAVGFACPCVAVSIDRHPVDCTCCDCERFNRAIERIEELRTARRENIEQRDRAAWEYIFHTASQISFFKRQAE